MSELTECNYCTLKRIKRDAKEKGKKVQVKRGVETDDSLGRGKDVYVDGEKTVWFWELTDHCVC
jgi:hypothetical protein